MRNFYILWLGLWDAPGLERTTDNLEERSAASFGNAEEAYDYILALDPARKDDYILLIKADSAGDELKCQDVLHKKLSEAQLFIKQHILKHRRP